MRLKYTFETMVLDDRIVAIPVGDGANAFHGVIKLNETAASIFELLNNETTEEEIVRKMEAKYEVAQDTLAEDVHKTIRDFEEKGFLV